VKGILVAVSGDVGVLVPGTHALKTAARAPRCAHHTLQKKSSVGLSKGFGHLDLAANTTKCPSAVLTSKTSAGTNTLKPQEAQHLDQRKQGRVPGMLAKDAIS
jgi:hypothetical protein